MNMETKRTGNRCIVKSCTKASSNSGVSFFRFPKDPERCRSWAIACGCLDLYTTKTSLGLYKSYYRVCSMHFEDRMFLNDLKNRLHIHALPTLYLDEGGCSTMSHEYLAIIPMEITIQTAPRTVSCIQEEHPDQKICLGETLHIVKSEQLLPEIQDTADIENKSKYTAVNPNKKADKRKMSLLIEKNPKRSRFQIKTGEKRKMIPKTNVKIKAKSFKSNSVTVKKNDKEFSGDKGTSGDYPINNAHAEHHFNGDKHPILYASSRIRKPNPKFQDFITSPRVVRAITNVSEKQKENIEVSKTKRTFSLSKNSSLISDIDPLDLLNTKDQIQPKDDIVRSFLPIIEKPKVHYDSDSDMEEASPAISSTHTTNTKKIEQLTLPMPDTKEKNTAIALQLIPSNVTDISTKMNLIAATTNQMKLSHSTPLIISSHSMTPLLISPKLMGSNTMPIIIATKFIPNLTPIAPNIKPQELKINDNAVNNVRHEKLTQNNKKKSNVAKETKSKKKAVSVDVQKKKDDVRYYLVESEGGASNRTKTPKANDVDFNKLVRTLKSVKLPAANWKIRIVVSRQQTITEVTFTNKEVNERCVKFSRIFTGYVITFGKSVVKLVGAPSKISSFNDVTILLDVIHHLSVNDPVLQYISDKDK